MSSDHSRRNFLTRLPGYTFLALAVSRRASALPALTQNPTMNQGNPGQAPPAHPSPNSNGAGSGGMGPGPSPAQHGGDYQPINIARPEEKNKNPAPRKPRKDLEADQKLLRDQVRQLVLDSHDLKKAVEQVGPAQSLTAELIGKTKEIEKLAHNIAVLAKG
jgi:hypothetical protein